MSRRPTSERKNPKSLRDLAAKALGQNIEIGAKVILSFDYEYPMYGWALDPALQKSTGVKLFPTGAPYEETYQEIKFSFTPNPNPDSEPVFKTRTIWPSGRIELTAIYAGHGEENVVDRFGSDRYDHGTRLVPMDPSLPASFDNMRTIYVPRPGIAHVRDTSQFLISGDTLPMWAALNTKKKENFENPEFRKRWGSFHRYMSNDYKYFAIDFLTSAQRSMYKDISFQDITNDTFPNLPTDVISVVKSFTDTEPLMLTLHKSNVSIRPLNL